MKKVPDPDPAGQKSPDPDPHPCRKLHLNNLVQDGLSSGAEEGAPRDHGHVDVRAEEDLGP